MSHRFIKPLLRTILVVILKSLFCVTSILISLGDILIMWLNYGYILHFLQIFAQKYSKINIQKWYPVCCAHIIELSSSTGKQEESGCDIRQRFQSNWSSSVSVWSLYWNFLQQNVSVWSVLLYCSSVALWYIFSFIFANGLCMLGLHNELDCMSNCLELFSRK
jgi:hypothetical protein